MDVRRGRASAKEEGVRKEREVSLLSF